MKCICPECGNSFDRRKNQIAKSKSGLVFCSRSCSCTYMNKHLRAGENNPNWKGGQFKKAHYYTRLALRSYLKRCIVCGCDDMDMLQVHHVDCNHSNDDLSNLAILCANHHLKVHRGGLTLTKEILDRRVLVK